MEKVERENEAEQEEEVSNFDQIFSVKTQGAIKSVTLSDTPSQIKILDRNFIASILFFQVLE